MLLDIALMIIFGLLGKHLALALRLPGLVGIMVAGILVNRANLLGPTLLSLSKDLRLIALIVILLRAGLELDKKMLKKAGWRAILMSFLPCLLEGLTVTFIAPYLLPLGSLEAGLLGFILAAVSPAVVVPSMIRLQKEGLGTNKGIPTIILAGSSVDDVFAITIFSLLLNTYQGQQVSIGLTSLSLLQNLVLGLLIGIGTGLVLNKIFSYGQKKLCSSEKLLVVVAVSLVLTALAKVISFASLLSIMVMGFVIQITNIQRAKVLASKLEQVWVFASLVLFFLVGAELPLKTALNTGLVGVLVVAIGLLGRSVGVFLALLGSKLSFSEKLFCTIAYMPKATVQAAIGALPLAAGVLGGKIILSVAVVSILLIAPLGLILIEKTAPLLLEKDKGMELETS